MRTNKLLAFVFLFLLTCFIFISNINAGIEDNIDNLDEKLQGVGDTKQKVESKWEYLGKEWQTIFLKNKYVAGIDNFLKKISFVFLFLFGEPYSLSLTLFFVIILWIYLALQFYKILELTAFSKGVAKIIGLGIVIIIAQISLLRKIVEALGNLIFAQKLWWARAIIVLIIIVALYVLSNLNSLLGKKIKESKEKHEKKQEKTDRKTLKSIVSGLLKGFGKD